METDNEKPPPSPRSRIKNAKNEAALELEAQPTKKLKKRIAIREKFKNYIKSRPFRSALKHTIATFIGTLFVFITPLRNYFGISSGLISIAILLNDVSKSVGTLFGAVLQMGFGVVGCMGLALLAGYVCGDNPWGLQAFLFAGIFGLNYLRKSTEWYLSILTCNLTLTFGIFYPSFILKHAGIFYHYQNGDFEKSIEYILQMGGNILLGATIALFINTILFPWSTENDLIKEIKSTLKNIQTALKLSNKAFRLEVTSTERELLNSTEKAMKKNFSRLSSLNKEIKLQVYFGFLSPEEFTYLIKSIKSILQCLSALESSGITKDMLDNEQVRNLLEILNQPAQNILNESSSSVARLEEIFSKRNLKILKKSEGLQKAIEEFSKTQASLNNKLLKRAKDELLSTNYDWIFRIYFWTFICAELSSEISNLSEKVNQIPNKRFPIYFPRNYFDFQSLLVNHNCGNPQQSKRSRLWTFMQDFQTLELRFALKVAIAVWIATIWGFLPETKDWYREWRGEWAAVASWVVLSPSIGASAPISFYRIIGTVVGGVLAIISWEIFPGNPYGLAFCCFLVSFVGFYLKYSTKFFRVGFVGLVTFLVVILGRMNASDSTIYELAYKRILTNSIGVIIALILSSILWPYFARRELRERLSTALAKTAVLYSSHVKCFHHSVTEDLLSEILTLETEIQDSILKCFSLLVLSKQEPRMKGPFPVKPYKDILNSLQFVLDRFLSTRIAITKEEVQAQVIRPLMHLRKDLTKNVVLYLYILSGSLRSRDKLPYYMPDPLKQRLKIINALRELPALVEGQVKHPSVVFYFSYALSLKDVIQEIEAIGTYMKQLFGEDDHIKGVFNEEKMETPIEASSPSQNNFKSLLTYTFSQ